MGTAGEAKAAAGGVISGVRGVHLTALIPWENRRSDNFPTIFLNSAPSLPTI